MPARTPLSDALSKELRRRGFSFVGSTIVYAFMQASGLVNDHTLGCFRRMQVAALSRDSAPARRAPPTRLATPSRSPRRPNSTSAVSIASWDSTRSGVSSARMTAPGSAVAP